MIIEIEILLYIFFIINIYFSIKIYNIIKNMYILKNSLEKNNCIIIINKPNYSYINKIYILIFDNILGEYIFDINDYTNIIKKKMVFI